MITLQQWLIQASYRLVTSPSPRFDAEILLGHVIGIKRSQLLIFSETLLNNAYYTQLNNLLERRIYGEPIAYIIGKWEFWSLPLLVSTDTLIPRPDTECLVEQVLKLQLPINAKVLDLGIGTGAITLALASERPIWYFTGIDNNLGAVNLACYNAARLRMKNVLILCGNWFKPLALLNTYYNLIVSNPPYIDINDPHLNQGDVCFEPKSALVADDCGLADIMIICCNAGQYLLYGGWLVLEHSWQQGKIVRKLLTKAGFINVTTVRDYGNNERVSLGQWFF